MPCDRGNLLTDAAMLSHGEMARIYGCRKSSDTMYVNARKTDAFDIFNLKYFIGPNPYLETAASVLILP